MPVWKLGTPEFMKLSEEHKKLVLDPENAVFEVVALCRDGTIISYEISARAINYM